MKRDPLATLIKIRRRACDDALRKLADALAQEDRVAREIQALERTIAHETEAASSPDGSDAVVEAFGVWLLRARQQLQTHRRVSRDRESDTVRARAELTACRTALESVEALHEQRRIAADRAREAAEARELEGRPSVPAIEEQT
jgi:hypothetical protein